MHEKHEKNNQTNLYKRRLDANLTQKELADMTGVSVHTISKLEQGVLKIENAKVDTAVALAKGVGVPLYKLFDDWSFAENVRETCRESTRVW